MTKILSCDNNRIPTCLLNANVIGWKGGACTCASVWRHLQRFIFSPIGLKLEFILGALKEGMIGVNGFVRCPNGRLAENEFKRISANSKPNLKPNPTSKPTLTL